MSAGWQPPQLWPFLYSEGIRGGMTRRQLRGAYWRSVFRGVRVWHEAPLDVRLRIRAAALLLPAGGAVGGRSAAALHGVGVLRSDGAESPMESRLRMVLVLAGLPAPAVNQPLYDACGVFLARPYLRIDRVLVEFDGSVHRDAQVFASDARRQNRLLEAGYTVLRYTASDV